MQVIVNFILPSFWKEVYSSTQEAQILKLFPCREDPF